MFRTSIVALALLSAASVNGSGTIKFGSSTEHITVRASGGPGRGTFDDKAAGGNVNGQISINCVNITANTATLSGLVTHNNNKSMIGQQRVLRSVDYWRKKETLD